MQYYETCSYKSKFSIKKKRAKAVIKALVIISITYFIKGLASRPQSTYNHFDFYLGEFT